MAAPNGDSSVWTLNDPLSIADPEVYQLIRKEKDRQRKGLEMIASENFTSLAVTTIFLEFHQLGGVKPFKVFKHIHTSLTI
jgi:hypothetical protein